MRASDGKIGVMAKTPAFVRPRRRSFADYGFTGVGAIFVGVSLAIGVAAMAQQINLLFLLFGLCMGAMLLSGLMSGKPLRRIRVARIAPDSAVAGQVFEIRYLLNNPSRWRVAYSIHVRETIEPDRANSGRRGRFFMGRPSDQRPIRGECEAYVVSVGPQQTVEVSAPVICLRRGRLPLKQIVLSTRFPFGLFRKSVAADLPGEVIIYPAVGRLRVPLRQPRGLPADTTAKRARLGLEPEEFHGLREFARGDNPRWIHWRRSVRIGRLLVREMRRAERPQLIIVIDPRASTEPLPVGANREKAIRAAATYCLTGLERGLMVGLVGLTTPPLIIPPVGGLEHRAKFLRELALIDAAPNSNPAEIAARLHWPAAWAGHCVILTANEDESLARLTRVFAARCRSIEVVAAGTERFDQTVQLEEPAVS